MAAAASRESSVRGRRRRAAAAAADAAPGLRQVARATYLVDPTLSGGFSSIRNRLVMVPEAAEDGKGA